MRTLPVSRFLILGFLPVYLVVLQMIMPVRAIGQVLPVGSWLVEEGFRRQQLLGVLDPAVSFTVRPISPVQAFGVQNAFDHDSVLMRERMTPGNGIYRMGWDGWTGHGVATSLQILPIERYTQYTTDHPWSMNDGGMIPAVGFQSMTRFGLYGEVGWFASLGERVGLRKGVVLSVQLQPEYVSAENKPFDGFPVDHRPDIWDQYYQFHSRIDWPERFGEDPYGRLSWGQSSALLSAGPVAAGVSNQNLWWGPGRHNALLMTNTAPGFTHLTLHTVRPLKTPIGSFEFQLVGGRLDSSGFYREVPDSTQTGYLLYYAQRKPNDWVYFNGVILTWQPWFAKGLNLGFTRAFQTYRQDMGDRFRDFLPVIMPLSKENMGGEGANDDRQNQLASLFVRYMMPESHAEVYLEFGRDDHAWNLRDMFLEPFHSRAYLVGFRKLILFRNPSAGGLELSFEHTQLQNPGMSVYRSTGPWYLHSQIRHGYTHAGQMLGAGVGPGGNMQTLEAGWLIPAKGGSSAISGNGVADKLPNQRGIIGLRFDRLVHNNDFHYLAIKDVRAHWVDWNLGFFGDIAFKNFVFHLRMDFVTTLNYQHYYEPSIIIDPWWNPGINRFNFIAGFGMSYRF